MGGSSIIAGLWKSTDGGQDWTKLSIPLSSDIGVTDVVLDPLSGIGGTGNLQILYAAVPNGGVYASSNGGASWVLMGGGIGDPLIQNDSDAPRSRSWVARRPWAPATAASSWPSRP